MSPFGRGIGADRGARLTFWKLLGLPLAGLVLAAGAGFVRCNGRVDRTGLDERLDEVRRWDRVDQLDRLLLPRFERSAAGQGRIEYVGRPEASGFCERCPVMVDVVEIRVDGEGGVMEMDVHQSLGFPRPVRRP